MDKNKIGIKLKRLRKQKNIEQEEISLMLEISTAEYNEIESGKRYPSDTSLMFLLKYYQLTEQELLRKDFIDHEKRKKIINYTQVGISLLLVLFYALPFIADYYGEGTLDPLASGFKIITTDIFGYYNKTLTIVFLILFVQLIFHLLLYTNLKKYSNTFKTLFLMMNTASLLLLYIEFVINNYLFSTLIIYIVLFVTHIAITMYDMLSYQVGHDFIHEKGRMRRILLLLVNIAYLIIFLFILKQTVFDEYYTLMVGEIIFFIFFGGYLLAYLILKKELFEKRLIITITFIIPPVLFAIFYFSFIIGSQNERFEPAMMFVILFMLLPAFIVNVDYFLDIIKDMINSDKKEIT